MRLTQLVNLPIEFSDKQVTPFGGMSLMKRFVDSLGIRDKLRELPLPQGQSNRAYDPVHVVESFWLSIWTGASRFIHADWLRYDTVLQEIFGFERMPSLRGVFARNITPCPGGSTSGFIARRQWILYGIYPEHTGI